MSLEYFKGWKDACYDVADFLNSLSTNAPEGVDLSHLKQIANGIKVKGDTALAMAEGVINEQH